jgi:hypothetical protein
MGQPGCQPAWQLWYEERGQEAKASSTADVTFNQWQMLPNQSEQKQTWSGY